MSCEVCGGATSEETSEVPAEDGYVRVVLPDESSPGLPKQAFEFCSLDCANMFIPDEEGV